MEKFFFDKLSPPDSLIALLKSILIQLAKSAPKRNLLKLGKEIAPEQYLAALIIPWQEGFFFLVLTEMKTFPYDVCWYCKAGGLIRTGTHCKEEESVYLRLLGCAKYMLGLNSLAFKAFEKECMNNHSPSYLFIFINGLFPLYVLGISIGIIFIFQSKLEYSRTFKMQKKTTAISSPSDIICAASRLHWNKLLLKPWRDGR